MLPENQCQHPIVALTSNALNGKEGERIKAAMNDFIMKPFDGITNYIVVDDNNTLDMTTQLSISGWIYKYADVQWASMLVKGGSGSDPTFNNYSIQNIHTSYGIFFLQKVNPDV